MALDMARKISLKPTSRRSSHVRTGQDRLARHWTRTALRRACAQVTQVFGTHNLRKHRVKQPAVPAQYPAAADT